MHDHGSVFSDLTSNVEEDESPLRNAKSFLSRHSAESADASSDMSDLSDLAMLDSGSVNYFNTSTSSASARVGGVASKSPFTHFTKLHALLPVVKK